ncbi:hypothetical protein [Photobacterium damselae]|uniref:hypothetical protein n=1 Tax=Photobacterium damselae TaxID=38293 RepID=UPI001F42F5AE|nr:hypothetical protein [Photobacterium damselae]UKA04969.1 hypothetical protein IHC89_22245 [Photobacterium damselae subsp. damselae]
MLGQKSNSLSVKNFTFIKILPANENLDDVLLFAGVDASEVEQEKIFHLGGSPFTVGGIELMEEFDNGYVIKNADNSCCLITETQFSFFFE